MAVPIHVALRAYVTTAAAICHTHTPLPLPRLMPHMPACRPTHAPPMSAPLPYTHFACPPPAPPPPPLRAFVRACVRVDSRACMRGCLGLTGGGGGGGWGSTRRTLCRGGPSGRGLRRARCLIRVNPNAHQNQSPSGRGLGRARCGPAAEARRGRRALAAVIRP